MCQLNQPGCLGAVGSPGWLCQPLSWRDSIAAGAGADAPTLGYLRRRSTALKVQQLLQHLKENRGVSRHPEGLIHTPRILQANPSNSGIWHYFPGCFSKQKGGECSALLLSLAGGLIAGDEEKHLQGMGNSIPVTSGQYLCKGRTVEFMQEAWASTGWYFISASQNTLAVGLTTEFPQGGTRTSWWGDIFCRASEKDQQLMPEGRKRLYQISRVLSPWLCGVVPSFSQPAVVLATLGNYWSSTWLGGHQRVLCWRCAVAKAWSFSYHHS